MSDRPTRLPIDGVIDLHTFAPRDVESLVPTYIDECLAHGILHLRIIHGKGKGILRRTVQAALSRHSAVASYRTADTAGGAWGATLVELRCPSQRTAR